MKSRMNSPHPGRPVKANVPSLNGVLLLAVLALATVAATTQAASITQTNAYASTDWSNAYWGIFTKIKTNDLINSGQTSLSSVSYNTIGSITGSTASLNDGTAGTNFWNLAEYAYCNAEASFTFTLNTAVNRNGYDLTGVDAFAAWNDAALVAQHFKISYTTVTDATVRDLYEASYAPADVAAVATSVSLSSSDSSFLVSGVKTIIFTSYVLNGAGISPVWRELDVQGVASPVPEAASLISLGMGAMLLLRRRRSV